jgi:hypothetical protein
LRRKICGKCSNKWLKKDAKENEKRVTTLGVLSPAAPVTWDATGRYLSFAVVKDGETALYIVSVGGGEVRKIVDFSADPQSIPYY